MPSTEAARSHRTVIHLVMLLLAACAVASLAWPVALMPPIHRLLAEPGP
jgi:hypothetical protein